MSASFFPYARIYHSRLLHGFPSGPNSPKSRNLCMAGLPDYFPTETDIFQ